jgi:hypothetical protein
MNIYALVHSNFLVHDTVQNTIYQCDSVTHTKGMKTRHIFCAHLTESKLHVSNRQKVRYNTV